ncbi:hypothetical protein XENORESO_019140 [Xenotaenia resolanae]|uniref:Uncharacterized protein n=1 Tax=Xenotaenia resolanae TaxID=208358 RepID=A0ABV0X6R0_9TELE
MEEALRNLPDDLELLPSPLLLEEMTQESAFWGSKMAIPLPGRGPPKHRSSPPLQQAAAAAAVPTTLSADRAVPAPLSAAASTSMPQPHLLSPPDSVPPDSHRSRHCHRVASTPLSVVVVPMSAAAAALIATAAEFTTSSAIVAFPVSK